MWPIVQVWYPQNTILNSEDQSDNVWSLIKTRQDNDVTSGTGLLYIENENWTFKIDPIRYGLWKRLDRTITWLNIQVQSTLKTKLNFHDQSERMWFITKSKHDNNVTIRTGMIEYDTELWRLVGSDRVRCMTTMRHDNNIIDRTTPPYAKNETKLSCLIRQSTIYEDDQIGQWRD